MTVVAVVRSPAVILEVVVITSAKASFSTTALALATALALKMESKIFFVNGAKAKNIQEYHWSFESLTYLPSIPLATLSLSALKEKMLRLSARIERIEKVEQK